MTRSRIFPFQKELLPDKLYNAFNNGDTTMLAVFFDTSTSADETMEAISDIRSIAGKQCFISGMSALVTDLEGALREGGADLCGDCRRAGVRGHDAAARRLARAVRVPRLHRHLDSREPRHELLHGRDLLHHQGALGRAAIGRHDGLFHLPLAQLQRAARDTRRSQGGHGRRHSRDADQRGRQLRDDRRGLHRPVLHELHARQ